MKALCSSPARTTGSRCEQMLFICFGGLVFALPTSATNIPAICLHGWHVMFIILCKEMPLIFLQAGNPLIKLSSWFSVSCSNNKLKLWRCSLLLHVWNSVQNCILFKIKSCFFESSCHFVESVWLKRSLLKSVISLKYGQRTKCSNVWFLFLFVFWLFDKC